MTLEGMPSGLVTSGRSPEFTHDTLPDALQREHALGAGRWGVLHVLEGSLVFVDLVSGDERRVRGAGERCHRAAEAPQGDGERPLPMPDRLLPGAGSVLGAGVPSAGIEACHPPLVPRLCS